MKLSQLTISNIEKAASLIDNEGIPKNRVWSQYYFEVKGKEYPFKYLAYRSLELIGETNVRFESNDAYRNYFKNELGLKMTHYPGGYNFFTKDELEYFNSIVGKPYRRNEIAHQVYPNKLNSLIAKVNYWVENIVIEGYKVKNDRSWLTSHTSNIRPYIWPRIYKDDDKDIFFNVEVNAANRFIGYKLDGYYETSKQLNATQIRTLDDFKAEIKWQWIKIKFDDLENYNWDKLINETQVYIRQHDHYYDLLRKRLYKEQKLARLIWNTNGWQKPSGQIGKAKKDTSEDYYGYEEWLFDADKIIDGYQYGFLESVNNQLHTYVGQIFDISLVTQNSFDNTKYWVTTLKNVEIISPLEAERVQIEYESREWFEGMNDDLREIGLDVDPFSTIWKSDPSKLFNIKFPSYQLDEIPAALLPIDEDHGFAEEYYILYDVANSLAQKYDNKNKKLFSFDSGSTEADLKDKGKRRSYTTEKELEFKHNEMQKKLLKYLQGIYGKEKVRRECNAFGGCRIDIVRKTDTGYIFYEIKTYNNLLTSIRLGIGQLLEYNLFPISKQAEKMVLVSHQEPTQKIKDYILHLKSFINLDFTYMHFDLDHSIIVSEI